jgi:cation transport ATPase
VSRATLRCVRQNLVFALVYQVLALTVAAGLLYPGYGWLGSPLLALGAIALATASIVVNVLRLRRTPL